METIENPVPITRPVLARVYSTMVSPSINRRRAFLSRLLPLTGLVVITIFFSITGGDRFLNVENLRVLVQQAATVAIAGFGLTFVIVAGSIDLSVGSVVALAGMVAATIAESYGAAAGVGVGMATGAACGLCNGFVVAVMRVPSFIATLAMLSVARGLTLIYSQLHPKVVTGFGALGREPGIYYVLGSSFVLSLFLFNATSFGRSVRAIGGDERVSTLSGVPMRRVKIAVFAFSGVMAGLGGVVLSARLGVATPNAAAGFELIAITAVVLGGTPLTGGIGTIWNTIVGAVIIQILGNGLVILGVSSEMQRIVQGTILVLAVFVALDRRKIGAIK